jgi:hypothetical protein
MLDFQNSAEPQDAAVCSVGWDFPDPTGGFLASLPGGQSIFKSDEEAANDTAIAEKRKAADAYKQYRPEGMKVRRESLQAALQMFNPLGQYVQRMTGMAPPDINSMFKPLEAEEQRIRGQLEPPPGAQDKPGGVIGSGWFTQPKAGG